MSISMYNPPQQIPQPLCMDARMLIAPAGTGVSSYAQKLRSAHRKIGLSQTLLLCDRHKFDGPAPAPFGRHGRWLRALIPGSRQARVIDSPIAETLLMAPDLFRLSQVYFDVHRRVLPVRIPGRPGIMHWTYPVPLAVEGWQNIYTVHDAIPLLHPELTRIDGRRYRKILNRLAERAACFITVSEAARTEIIRAIECPPNFVIDCSLAVDAGPVDAVHLPQEVTAGGFLLACGTVEARKNLARLLEAYQQSCIAMPLVIAGPDGWGAADIASLIEATPGAIRLPYLDRTALHALIGHARALVMPSLAEGFGLPVAEAMARGTPVVTSNRGALAETAATAALLVDPFDVTALATALRRIASDDALCSNLAAAGRINAQRFTLERFAERLTGAYAAVMANAS